MEFVFQCLRLQLTHQVGKATRAHTHTHTYPQSVAGTGQHNHLLQVLRDPADSNSTCAVISLSPQEIRASPV